MFRGYGEGGEARRMGCMAYVCACAVFDSGHPEHRLTLHVLVVLISAFVYSNALHEMFYDFNF